MSSDLTARLKVEAFCWLRYTKKMGMVCTEVGRWSADCLGICDTMSIEVEIKASKADLLREFVSKQNKHYWYDHATDSDASVPNYLYFCVPDYLEAFALTTLTTNAPKAGLLVFPLDTKLPAGCNAKVVRKAQKLRTGAPSPRMVRTAMLRMGSELCRAKQLILLLRTQICDSFDNMMDEVLAQISTEGLVRGEDIELAQDETILEPVRAVEGPVVTRDESSKGRSI